MDKIRNKTYSLLRKSESFFKTDMVYFMKGSAWLNANMIATTLLGFLLSIAFAQFLPKEQYGLYQFVLSIGAILVSFTLTGMNTSVSRSVAMGFEGSFVPSIKVQLKYGIISSIISLGISFYYFYNNNFPIAFAVLILGLFIPIQNSFNTYPSFIGGKKDFRRSFWFSQALVVPYTAIMIVSLMFVHNPVVLVLINLGFNSLGNVLLHLYTVHLYKPNKKVDPSTISYGKHLSLIGVLSAVSTQLDNILVYHYIGAAQLAVYVFATTLPERANTVAKTVGNMAFPKFANKTVTELRKVIIYKSFQTAGLVLIISLLYVGAAPYVFQLFFPKYLDAIIYSQAYSIMLVFSALSTLPTTALIALQARREILFFNIFSPIISIGIILGASFFYGIWGLIIAKGLVGIVIFVLALILLKFVKEPETKAAIG